MGQSNNPSENYLFLNVMVNFVIVNQKLTGSALHIEKNQTIRQGQFKNIHGFTIAAITDAEKTKFRRKINKVSGP